MSLKAPEHRRIFLSGSNGFVGRAAREYFQNAGHEVRCLTRRNASALEKEFPTTQWVAGDLQNPNSWKAALEGVDVVIHMAKSDDADAERRRAIDRDGTAALLASAEAAGVSRFIHLSSIVVYGVSDRPLVDETFPRIPGSDIYSQTKVEVEALVQARRSKMKTIILQPANIYGPGHSWWGGGMVDLMRRGRLMVIDGGQGTANLIHVDDVVLAMARAIEADVPSGECYLLTDGRPRPWRTYFQAIEKMLGSIRTVYVSIEQAKLWSQTLRDNRLMTRLLRRFRRTVKNEPVTYPWDDEIIERFASKTIFSIDKARRDLGFVPTVAFERGFGDLMDALHASH